MSEIDKLSTLFKVREAVQILAEWAATEIISDSCIPQENRTEGCLSCETLKTLDTLETLITEDIQMMLDPIEGEE